MGGTAQHLFLHKDVPSPSCQGGEQTGSKVPGRVDGIATVEPVGQTNGRDEQTYKDRLHPLLGFIVVCICDAKYPKEEEEGTKELEGGGMALNGKEEWGGGECSSFIYVVGNSY